MDDETHYRANVRAYQAAAPLVAGARRRIEAERRSIEARKSLEFSAELLALDRVVQDYRSEKTALGAYASELAARTRPSANVQRLLDALRLETGMVMSRVESDRTRLLQELLPLLSAAQESALSRAALDHREGRTNAAAFYARVEDLCASAGISWDRYPAVKAYFDYTRLAQAIDAEALFDELRKMEEAAFVAFSATDAQREIVRADRANFLTGKLIAFALTREEWKEYEAISSKLVSRKPRLHALRKFLPGSREARPV